MTARARRIASRSTCPASSAADALSCPFVLIGSEAELAEEVRRHQERWGIDRFTVRVDAFDVAARLIKWLQVRRTAVR